MGLFSRKRKPEFMLGNAEDLHREAPQTFHIPTREEREAVAPGDVVKLMFELVEATDDGAAERMWVAVTAAEAGRYVGSLNNEPFLLKSIGLGDRIEFGPEHILSLWEDAPKMPGDDGPFVAIFKRLDEQNLRPRLAHRDEPLKSSDSGWRLVLGDETDDEIMDPANTLFLPLASAAARWPELQEMFDSGDVNSDWVWNDTAGAYVPEPTED